MTKDDILRQTPENWLELLDKSEIDEETIKVTGELIALASKRLESLLQALKEYTIHSHQERNHQGKGNCLLFPNGKYYPDNGN